MGTDQRLRPGQSFRVEAASYNSKVTCIDPDAPLVLTERDHTYDAAKILIETYASAWFLGFSANPDGLVAVRSGSEIVSFRGPTGIFIPKFTLIEWHVKPGRITWTGLNACSDLPQSAPKQAAIFPWRGPIPRNEKELIDFFSATADFTLINEGRFQSSVAAKVKQFIDKHFTEDLKISEVARELGISREAMTRAFSKAYGISPIEYRHKLRLFDACRLMGLGSSVTDAIFEVGFSDPAQFVHHFRRHFGTTPVNYSPQKMSRRQLRAESQKRAPPPFGN